MRRLPQVIGLAWLVCCAAPVFAADSVIPLPEGHAHNDYAHARPLQDALDQGFCSIEADIWLEDGRLLVGHNRTDLKPERTLQALYLDPLQERIRRNGGHVYPGVTTCTLLIDIKSDAESTYAKLREVLRNYPGMLTVFTPTNITTNAITAILSGNRATATVAADPVRWVAIDGRLPDLETPAPVSLIPLVSDNWTQYFTWRGEGEFPANERARLQHWVAQAHAQGRRLRFWAAPDNPAGWRELHAAGVDLISTDDLAGLAQFLHPGAH
ncbi:MAG TPA: phosphatidylinositol-specific phospholipase C/glycerophosphodiester phosphodiesterase family protein [Dongiaceae bacterium]|nr:phosphatidylinositol-specific phospholipase C/glycerophosphodiester phosphodiesterase family protein [Dongiaceae bacterium]